MPTSGTTAFDLDFTDIAEEAWERAGREMRTGNDLRTARRSMNLLMLEWQNRGINLWTIASGSIPLIQGTADYTLPADTIDLLDHVVRAGNTDIHISRLSVNDYANLPNKSVAGRPIQFYPQRLRDSYTVTLWPVPDRSSYYTLEYWRMRRIEDAGNGVETPDMNARFYPALVSGLAYHVAMKVPELADRLPMLQQEYDKQFKMAAEEDRDKTSMRIVPAVR